MLLLIAISAFCFSTGKTSNRFLVNTCPNGVCYTTPGVLTTPVCPNGQIFNSALGYCVNTVVGSNGVIGMPYTIPNNVVEVNSVYTYPSVNVQPVYNYPSVIDTTYSYPTYSYPTYNTPTYNTPIYTSPTYSYPTYTTPTYNYPTYTYPTYSGPQGIYATAPMQDENKSIACSSNCATCSGSGKDQCLTCKPGYTARKIEGKDTYVCI